MAECLKKGYLLKCPQKARAFKKWNSRWFVLYGNSARGRVRLEYYDNEKAWQQERGKRIIPLVHCVSIKPVWNKDYNHVLEIVTSDKTFYLGAGSKEEEKAWFKSLCKIVFGNANRNSIVTMLGRPEPLDMGYHSLDRGAAEESNLADSKAAGFVHSSPQLSRILGSIEKIEQDTSTNDPLNITDSSNDTVARNAASSLSCELSSIISFESGFDDGASMASSMAEGPSTYHVSVRPTIASQESGMNGAYILQITPLTLTLMDPSSHDIIAEWPIQHLRRYGRGRTKFSFEAGDKCKSAIGVFTFNTVEGDAIFHQVDTYAKKLSSLQRMDPRDKRISLPSDQFRTLTETKRRTRSEGKLLDKPYESSSNSTINDMEDSNEKINIGFQHQSTFPSKSRACTLDVIRDHEAPERIANELGARPRMDTFGSVEVVANEKEQKSEDDLTPLGESTESLLDNPAGSQNDVKSEEEVKSKVEKDLRDITQLIQTSFEKLDSDLVEDEVKTEANKDEADFVKESEQPCNEISSVVDGPKEDFQPLSTSESAAEDNEAANGLDTFQANNNDVDNESGKQTRSGQVTKDTNENNDGSIAKAAAQAKLTRVLSNEVEKEATLSKNAASEATPQQEAAAKVPLRRKLRKQAYRNKSFELGSLSAERPIDNRKQSGSFSFFDYKKYAYNPESSGKSDGPRRLQRFSSVKKTVEMYEKLANAASESRLKGFTLWRRKSTKSSQKPDVVKKTAEGNV